MTFNQLSKFYNVWDKLSVWNDVFVARGSRAVIPTKLRKTILDLAHEGHLDKVRMKQRSRETVWWPGIDQNIEEMVQACVACVKSGKSLQPKPVPLHPIPWLTKPWEKIQIDIVGEL